jgi:hypothetical protein
MCQGRQEQKSCDKNAKGQLEQVARRCFKGLCLRVVCQVKLKDLGFEFRNILNDPGREEDHGDALDQVQSTHDDIKSSQLCKYGRVHGTSFFLSSLSGFNVIIHFLQELYPDVIIGYLYENNVMHVTLCHYLFHL